MHQSHPSTPKSVISIVKMLILTSLLLHLLLFVCGVLCIIIAEIKYTSLVDEFSVLLDAHLLGIVIPSGLIITLFLTKKREIVINSVIERIDNNEQLAFLYRASLRLISRRKVVVLLTDAVVIILLIHSSFPNHTPEPQKKNIVFLYPNVFYIPDVVFEISILPSVIMQYLTSSPKHTIALPLLSTSFEDIAAHSDVIIIGAHGKHGYLRTYDIRALTSSTIKISKGNAKEVYLGVCSAGEDMKGWQSKFPNARIFATRDEFSQLQGFYYLLVIAPFKYS